MFNTSDGTSHDLATRPSTGGAGVRNCPANMRINRSSSIKKVKPRSAYRRTHEAVEDSFKDRSVNIENNETKLQMYYKSLEPYLQKKKHISGYEASPRKKDESSSSKSRTSDHSRSISNVDPNEIELNHKAKARTRENIFFDTNKSFSRISEEENSSDKNSYGLKLVPKKIGKKSVYKPPAVTDVKRIVSSYF